MAVTPNFKLPILGGGEPASLKTINNNMVTALDTSLKAAMDAQDADFAADIAASTNLLRGTAAQRAATTSKYWQFWLDTDGSQKLYVGNKSGGWRQYCGETTVPAGGWSSTSSGLIAARTPNVTVPTVLLTTETLLASATSVGTGFGAISLTALTRNASNTTASFRQMQFLNTTATNAFTFAWCVSPM